MSSSIRSAATSSIHTLGDLVDEARDHLEGLHVPMHRRSNGAARVAFAVIGSLVVVIAVILARRSRRPVPASSLRGQETGSTTVESGDVVDRKVA